MFVFKFGIRKCFDFAQICTQTQTITLGNMHEKLYLRKQTQWQARSQAGAWVQLHPLRVPLHPLALCLAPYVHYVLKRQVPNVRTATPRLLILSSLDGTSSVRLKLCCTVAPRLLIFSSIDGSSCVRLKLCCTAEPRLLIFSSIDGSSCVRLKLCCTAAPRLLILFSLDGRSCVRLKLCCTAAPRLLNIFLHMTVVVCA